MQYLNNEQLIQLKNVMNETLQGLIICEDGSDSKAEECDTIQLFITEKRIEGCSEKTLNYYQNTIEAMISGIGKTSRQITTDDLRQYLIDYQVQRGSSKVTIDNIR